MRPLSGASGHLESIASTRLHSLPDSEERWSLLTTIYFAVVFNLAAWAVIGVAVVYLL